MDAITTIHTDTDDQNTEQPRHWRDVLPVHPAAELFPLMSAEELRELADDIAKNGLSVPVSLYRDPEIGLCLLDGRNRADALELVGKGIGDDDDEGLTELVGEDDPNFDPYAYVVSKNIRRRHLSAKERQDLLIALIARSPGKSDRQLGRDIGVDHKTIGRARAKGEDVGRIPHVETRTDTKGREQPAHRTVSAEAITDTATDDTPYDRTDVCDATDEEMKADPATYWRGLTDDAFKRLCDSFHKARLAARVDEDHAMAAHALGELIAAATELKTFYETHLLAPGRRLQ